MKITGTIMLAMPETSGTSQSGKQWRKQTFVCRYDESNAQYPKEVLFDVMNQKIDELNIQQGGKYELEIDFSVREWKEKRFMQASAWKATRLDAAPTQSAPQTQSATPTLDAMGISGYQKPVEPAAAATEDTDLPF